MMRPHLRTTASRSLLAAALTLALACNSKSPTPPPIAPVGVSAIAADGSVTVSWESSAGATGYTVYYNADSSGAVTTGSLSVDAGTALFVSVPGLVDGTKYGFAVAARGLGGEGPLSSEVTATPQINAPIAVASTSPADGATNVARDATIAITFNRAATASSIAGQATAGSCSGSVQLSSDDFNTCAALGATPAASNGDLTFTFTPASALTAGATYLLRVTTGAHDANGIAMTQQFTQAHGFSIAAALAVTSITPADGATLVPLSSTITVAFSRALTAASATGNTTSSACTGSLQLSASGFAANGCLQLSSVVVSGQSVVLTPAAPLPPGALVALLVTTALLDDGGNALSTNYSSAGFTTVPPLAVASVNPDGQSNVDFLPTLSVAFASPAAPASMTTNIASSTLCSGSVQLSKASDNFASNTCVPMAAQPVSNDGGTTFTFAPAQRLASNSTYLIRITTAAHDPSGSPLAAAYTSAGFTTRPFAVVSISPADGTNNLSRNPSIVVTFNRPAGASSLGTGTCAGPFLLVKSGQTGTPICTGLATPVINGSTVTLTPGTFLSGAANYGLTISTSLKDDSGGALLAAYSTTAGFTTLPALAVVSTQPAAGATGVPLNTNIQVTFNQATTAATVTANTGSSGCGSISLTPSSGTCIAFTAQPASLDGKTFNLTPAAPLAMSTSYALAVSLAALDASGVPLASAFSSSFTTGTGTDTTPPGEVTGVIATPALQSISISWTNPGDLDFSRVRIHQCAAAASCSNDASANPIIAEVAGVPSASAQTLLTGLIPSTTYILRLTTVDQSGNESTGNGDTTATAITAFSGLQSGAQTDFTASQTAPAVGAGVAGDTISVWFTWTSSMLYAAMGNSGGTSLLATNQDVLWIAVDTDPDVDQTGEWSTPSLGNNNVIWPFKADYIVELIPNGLNTSVVVRAVATPCALIHSPAGSSIASDCPTVSGALNFDGAFSNGVAELGVPAAALGSPAKARLAFAAINSSNGYAYSLAPLNPSAIDVTGYFGSSTASFNPGANIFNAAQAASSALPSVSPLSPAASLVLLSVQASSVPTLKGSLHPLSYTLTDTSFALRDDGTGGDVTAGDGVYSGAFNFGGVSQELFFKYGEYEQANGQQTEVDEFPMVGVDRIWTLSGTAESLPQLSYGTVYSKNHSFQLTFAVTNPGGTSSMKEVLGNVGELGNFTPGAGPVLTSLGSGTWTTAAVTFQNHDFTVAPLQWKAHDNGSNTWENDSGGAIANHQMNDDVLNKRTLSWTWNDYSNDPF